MRGRTLTLAAYRESGGVRGALARRADEIYGALDTAKQEAARQLFLRLITLGEGVEDTRRRTIRTELTTLTKDEGRRTDDKPLATGDGAEHSSFVLGPSSAIDKVIDVYGHARLLSFDRDPVTRADGRGGARGPAARVGQAARLAGC